MVCKPRKYPQFHVEQSNVALSQNTFLRNNHILYIENMAIFQARGSLCNALGCQAQYFCNHNKTRINVIHLVIQILLCEKYGNFGCGVLKWDL